VSIPEFAGKVRLLQETAAEAGRTVEATWAGIVVAGKDEDQAGEMLDARARKGLLESSVWAGSASSLVWWFQGLETAGASWAVVVPSSPADRLELIAEHVLPHLRPAS
jgi:alkanesulfonate monooxygenase SsuD/methylene tetrahydromethanopterin reductase-like flavin-dependent oxidoreductase (luciferase family)